MTFFLILCLFFTQTVSLSLKMSIYLGKNPVFVAGGSKGVGLEVIKQLSALGTPVRALVRQPEAKEMLEKLPGVQAFVGNAFDEDAIQSTMSKLIPSYYAHM
jgi:short-subunit dehydrogenase involved in D-alanine esterification of teichoic acids